MDKPPTNAYRFLMNWSLPIGIFSGIRVRVHWTLLAMTLLLLLGSPNVHILMARTMLILGICTSILLHELAHAWVARRCGLAVKGILLSPIGGSAQISGYPKSPKEEASIALAGPFMSFGLGSSLAILADFLLLDSLFMWLAGANMVIGVFNLIPAFPLDGGKVARAALTSRFGLVRATKMAIRLGRFVAFLLLGISFVFSDGWWLALIGIFILMAGRTEEIAVRFRALVDGRTAADVMQRTLQVLPVALQVKEALTQAKTTSQSLFPVCFGSRPMGLISLGEMERLVQEGSGESGLGSSMSRNFLLSSEDEPLAHLLQRMAHDQVSSAVVMEEGEAIGVVGFERVMNTGT